MIKQLIVVKPGTLSAKDKEKITKAGHVVIEHPEPHVIQYKNFEQEEYLPYIYCNCYKCGERIYLLKERDAQLRRTKNSFFCSQGHSQAFL